MKGLADTLQEALVRDCASEGCKSAKALNLPPSGCWSSLPSPKDRAGVLQPCPSLGVKAVVDVQK